MNEKKAKIPDTVTSEIRTSIVCRRFGAILRVRGSQTENRRTGVGRLLRSSNFDSSSGQTLI